MITVHYDNKYHHKMSTGIGFFVEIDQLQNRIKELESKLEQERQEFREMFMRMKANITTNTTSNSVCQQVQSINPFYDEVCYLRDKVALMTEENIKLKEENEQLRNHA